VSGRRIFVGDIQGCLAQLQRLLREVGFDAARDRLHPTGDLVAKGPDSLGVLRLCRELGAQPVLGNHDLHWLEHGRIADDALAKWLSGQPIIREYDDLILVHAGLHPRWDDRRLARLRPEDVDYAVTVRYCDADGDRPAKDWPPPGPPYRPWTTITGSRAAWCLAIGPGGDSNSPRASSRSTAVASTADR
jgi:hypothetical protein